MFAPTSTVSDSHHIFTAYHQVKVGHGFVSKLNKKMCYKIKIFVANWMENKLSIMTIVAASKTIRQTTNKFVR